MAIGNIRLGSWGTPEFGVTEWLQKTLAPKSMITPQGGSSLSSMGFASPVPSSQTAAAYSQPKATYSGVGGAYPIQGGVLGATTSSGGTGGGTGGGTAPAGDTGGGGTPTIDPYMQWLDQQYGAQEQAINEMEGGLGSQKSSMEQMAQNTYQQGANTLGTQYGTSKGDIESYQTKTLQDIGDALRNMWQQGGRMLGSRGASDSSAAGMYNYAVSKLGSKQRGDVMGDVSRRLTNLKGVYDTNMQNLELEKNNQVQQVSQWYNEALNSIRGMRSELQQQKSEQALNMAINMLNDARSQAANKQSILDSWASQKAQSLPQLQQMLASNAAAMQPYQGLGANAQFSGSAQSPGLFGFGNTGQDSLNWLQGLIPTK